MPKSKNAESARREVLVRVATRLKEQFGLSFDVEKQIVTVDLGEGLALNIPVSIGPITEAK
jgi:hypothetical protein